MVTGDKEGVFGRRTGLIAEHVGARRKVRRVVVFAWKLRPAIVGRVREEKSQRLPLGDRGQPATCVRSPANPF